MRLIRAVVPVLPPRIHAPQRLTAQHALATQKWMAAAQLQLLLNVHSAYAKQSLLRYVLKLVKRGRTGSVIKGRPRRGQKGGTMKTKKLNKKLTLSKATIANLEQNEQSAVRAGYHDTEFHTGCFTWHPVCETRPDTMCVTQLTVCWPRWICGN